VVDYSDSNIFAAPRYNHVRGGVACLLTDPWDATQELPHACFADRVFALLPGSEEYDAECERGVCPWPANDDDDPEFLPVRLCIFA
jgi:hypothetical protein